MPLDELIPVLQTAIGPGILISGVGMLLLTITNRLGRTIDRSRALIALRSESSDSRRLAVELQLGILWKRARLLRRAITLATIAALLAALLIIVLFMVFSSGKSSPTPTAQPGVTRVVPTPTVRR